VEIATGDDLAGLDQNKRIVSNGIGLDDQRARGLCDQVERGARDLRLATQTLGILHALVALEM
jgi:sugar (pentulose or hexulose) kinase